MKRDAGTQPGEPELKAAIEIAVKDAIGASAEPQIGAASAPEITPEADEEGGSDDEPSPADDSETAQPEPTAKPQQALKLDRLQKILAQAGVASRRRAEELITQGRVQVNGQVVTTLGSKADPGRDHIRVDGKLIHSAERLRYFMLNKPKGFVTTASDPEGRPTVMQFFEKLPERIYPVGRLDYQSEGLLLVTNDGELANRLTRAASGVEKTYLVKVSGRPTEAELDVLRQGVAIERGKPGSPQVNTAPARIRQVRHGDNPWYEVVLIEGRNRELRKMFQGIGHFVEKIRRVGYGPLVLDIEPGKSRELGQEELAALRRAAEGKPQKRPRDLHRGAEERGRPAKRDPSRRAKPFGEPSEAGARRGHERTDAKRRGPGGANRDRAFGPKPQWKKRAFRPQDAAPRGATGGEVRANQRRDRRGDERGGPRRDATDRFSQRDARESSRRPSGERRAGQSEFRRPSSEDRPESRRADQGEFRAKPGRPPRSGSPRESDRRTGSRPERGGRRLNRPGSDSRGHKAGGPRNQPGRPFGPGFKRRPESADAERSTRRDRPDRHRPNRGR